MHFFPLRYKGDGSEASARTMAHIRGRAMAAMGLSPESDAAAAAVVCALDLLVLEVEAEGGVTVSPPEGPQTDGTGAPCGGAGSGVVAARGTQPRGGGAVEWWRTVFA